MHATTNANGTATPTVYRRELAMLRAYMGAEGYTPHATEAVVVQFEHCGHLEGCPDLEPEDRAGAYEWLEAGFPAVPAASPEWDEHATEPEGAPTYRTTDEAFYVDASEYIHGYNMGCGPDKPPYVPTAEDLDEMGAWSASLDGEGMAFPRERTAQERIEAAAELIRYQVEHEA